MTLERPIKKREANRKRNGRKEKVLTNTQRKEESSIQYKETEKRQIHFVGTIL